MKKMYSVFISAILMGLLLTGCATTQRLATPSGRPEVTINTVDRGKIKSVIINKYMNTGWSIVSESDYSIIFSKPMEGLGSVAYQALLGNSYSSTPQLNVRINMATTGTSTRVIAQGIIKMQNAFGREDVTNVTDGKVGVKLQKVLQSIKAQVEAQ